MTETRTTTSDEPDGRPTASLIDWAAALAEHGRRLRTAVLARLGERQAVDEVMQEVALAAVAQRAPLAEPERAGPWLYRLAVRQALLYRRRVGRQRKLFGRYAEREGIDGQRLSDPLDWLVRDERRQLVREALGRLPERDAEILWLKYSEGLSYRELAQRLGAAESAIETRLHRARQRLRDELSNRPAIEEKLDDPEPS
ncbi:MAG: sigma-70 family RNA polymerase sigma factor [Isosphaeraceae bacterium]|nr:sigma-70 family RNA polymerase sigma factor [Isosphaeraceae bacterium]